MLPMSQKKNNFPKTHWSLVVQAGLGSDDERGRAALAALCEAYWHPVYRFLRRSGHQADKARDLLQEFFAYFLTQTHLLKDLDRQRGRFRNYLLVALKHFLKRMPDIKHGVAVVPLESDVADEERRYLTEPATTDDPEKVFERRWAIALLERVFHQLRERFKREDKLEWYLTLEPLLAGDDDASYQKAAQLLGKTQGALRVAVHRLRGIYREALRLEISHTVADPFDIDAERRYLFSVLARV